MILWAGLLQGCVNHTLFIMLENTCTCSNQRERERSCTQIKQHSKGDQGKLLGVILVVMETCFNCSHRIPPKLCPFLAEGHWIVHNGSGHTGGHRVPVSHHGQLSPACSVSSYQQPPMRIHPNQGILRVLSNNPLSVFSFFSPWLVLDSVSSVQVTGDWGRTKKIFTYDAGQRQLWGFQFFQTFR